MKKQNLDQRVEMYIKTLTEDELKVLKIAQNELKESLFIPDCNGFLEWEKKGAPVPSNT